MGKLDVRLAQRYKSFNAGFETSLEGDLIILSGINGSGKSQILDVIRGYEFQNYAARVDSQISLDNVRLSRNEIIYKAFKEYVQISELSQASVQSVINARSQIHSQYTTNRLNPEDAGAAQYSSATAKARELLIAKYGEDYFNSGSLTLDDIEKVIKPDFIWKPDDIFMNTVGEIFYNYCLQRHALYAEAGEKGKKADISKLGSPPWKELNDLFKELRFDCRFKDEFRLSGTDIDEQPRLYALNDDGTINYKEWRPLSHLSDGEKAVISLCFASLSGTKPENIKLLLLDEYDATLNPSLAEKLFIVLDKYFLSKGVMIIFVTHSPVTISLAPDSTSFYEVYKPKGDRERVLKVSRNYYEELQKVHKRFYSQIADQEARINEIIKLNEKLNETNKELEEQTQENVSRPLIITEGLTDALHLERAIQKLGINLEVEFFDQSDEGRILGSSNLYDTLYRLSLVGLSRRVVGIFDRDEKDYISKVGDLKDFGNNVFAFCIPVPKSRKQYTNISIEFYFTDEELHKGHEGKSLYFDNEVDVMVNKRTGEHILQKVDAPRSEDELLKKVFSDKKMCDSASWIHSKTKFANLVHDDKDFAKDFDFAEFKLILDKIKQIVENDRNL
jgi:ABC-type molybdenum transport system ATPase subunit/photorepair protein PhrA